MALTNNPNKTKSIEKKWRSEINVRWRDFTKAVIALNTDDLVLNIDDKEKFDMDTFIGSFADLAARILLGGDGGEWQNKYQTTAYDRTAKRTVEGLKPKLPLSATEAFLFNITDNLLTLPSSRNELDFLHARANGKLEGWVNSLVQEVTNIVRTNFGKLSKFELADLIKERIDVSASRARMIATTEITQAAQHSSINLSKEMEVVIGEQVDLRWVTVKDSKVRHLHAKWHGQVFTADEAEKNMSISPFNCRCGLKPVVESLDTEKEREKFKKERKILLKNEKPG